MVVEALEAPKEMMEQGAVAFLAPALIIGMIVGAVSTGAVGILAVTIALAFLGLFFGILGDISANSGKLTIRSMVEMAMLGSEVWPVGQVIQQITNESRQAALGAAIGASITLLGGVAGVGVSWLILNFLATR
jgi:hypothetical protein